MDHYLVIGNPIKHSLSPKIHTAFAQKTQQVLTYDALCVEPADFFNTLDDFFNHKQNKGANITAPFKAMAYEYTRNHCSTRAQLAKAVNTLYINPKDSLVWGDNTDGIGLLSDFKRLHWSVTNKKILILGAGGAVRGILPALFSQHPASITISNRTPEKVQQLQQDFAVFSLPGQENFTEQYDIIINSIPSAHIDKDNAKNTISLTTCYYDLNYSRISLDVPVDTPWITMIKQFGCEKTSDGFGMLLAQAAESFFIWRGVRPMTLK
jgi:shikimate dehydrogenase